MRIKERLGEAFRLYFILVTLITVLLMVLGLLFDSDRTFGYEAFVSPLIYAAVGVIPVFFFHSDKEISMKQLIIRRIIQELSVEALILLIVFNAPNIPSERPGGVIAIAAGVLVVFILSMVVEYIFELTQANEMNGYLEEYRNRNKE
jgi:hypothetical protein